MKNKGWRRAKAILFLLAGLKNWKDGKVEFKDHQSSATHITALQLIHHVHS